MSTILTILLFACGMALSLGLAAHFYGRAFLAKRNLAFLTRVADDDVQNVDAIGGYRIERLARSGAGQRMLRNAPFVGPAVLLIEQAGAPLTVAALLCQMLIYGLGAFAIPTAFGQPLAAAAVTGLLGSLGPLARLDLLRRRRRAEFEAQLPKCIEMIALYLRAGRSLSQAFVAATEELGPPARQEFASAAEEYRLGRPLEIALRRVADRFPKLIGFRLFTIAAAVLTQTGGNLVEVLDRIRKTMEASTTYTLRLNAMTSEARLSAKILGITPGIFMLYMAYTTPNYFDLMLHNPIGRVGSCVLVFTWITGVIWVRVLMQSRAL